MPTAAYASPLTSVKAPTTQTEVAPATRPDQPATAPARRRAPVEDTVGGLKLGQSVRHPKFGDGTVLGFDGDGDRTRVEVQFEQVGLKVLMLAYAKLEPA